MGAAEIFNSFLNGIRLLLKFYYLWLESIVLAFVPLSWRQKDVTGEIVLITGAGSGLGRLMAKRFALLGCQLVLWDMNTAGLEETEKEIKHTGATISLFTIDLSNRDAVYKTADKVKRDIGNVDILVNNAGIVTGKPFLECSDNLMVKTMEVNVMSHFWTAKAFLPAMMERNHGHIVNIASAAGVFGTAYLVDYCASKFADVGFDEALSQEIRMAGKDKVYSTVICPFFFNTGMFEGVKTSPLLPLLDQHYVADTIIKSVLANIRMVFIPGSLSITNILSSILPVKCSELLGDYYGTNEAMVSFVGRQKEK